MKYCRFLLLALLFLFPCAALAQQTNNDTLTPDLSLTTIPTDPKPLEQVSVQIQSFSIDLSQASILWSYNNQTIASGIGKTSVQITAPASGQVATLTATVGAVGFSPTTATILIRPASVDVIWQAVDSYTPPFYKGKALLPLGGTVKVVAIPSAIAPRGISYNWSRNGSSLPEFSGYNKSSLLIKQDPLQGSETINLSTESGTFSGTGTTTLLPRNPSLLAYQKIEGFIDYAHGYTSAIGVQGPGTTIRFEPLFFSVPSSITHDLVFGITVNGQAITGEGEGNEIRFSRPSTGFASANITTEVTTTAYTLQNLKRLFNLSFN